jgi:hypothetical protein
MLWILLLGLGIWRHAHETVQPPIYDALTYYQKAQTVWTAIYQHQLINPLNLSPAVRPPGTVLMSFPFGFNGNYHRFYFRSVFLPVLLVVLAVYIAGPVKQVLRRDEWTLALIAIFLSSLPFFFQFEWSMEVPSITSWGLVDAFVGTVAMLAVAFMVRSLRTRSKTWFVVTLLLVNLTIFIKPAGVFIMVLIGFGWAVMGSLLLTAKTDSPDQQRPTRFILMGALLLGVSFVISVIICRRSDYLGQQVMLSMLAGQIILHGKRMPTAQLIASIPPVVGYLLPFMLLLFWILFPLSLRRSPAPLSFSRRNLYGALAAALASMALGVWFWLYQPEPRYSFPFILMAVAFTIPLVVPALQALPRWLNILLLVVSLLQPLNLALLLLYAHPPATWQRFSGVNLTSNGYKQEVLDANRLLNVLRAEGKSAVVYSFYSGPPTYVFESIGNFAGVIQPSLPRFTTRLPVTWLVPNAFRREELLGSDYVLFTPTYDPVLRQRLLAKKAPADFDEESAIFHAWFSERDERDGLKLESQTSAVRLLKIIDRRKLRAAFDMFFEQHSWPAFFQAVNARRWWSKEELTTLKRNHPLAVEQIQFGDDFIVDALSVDETENLTTIRVWWQPVGNRSKLLDWYMFFHVLDRDGNILIAQNVPLATAEPATENQKVRLDVTAFPNLNDKASVLAFGFGSEKGLLPADRGKRDWQDQRVLVSLPPTSNVKRSNTR